MSLPNTHFGAERIAEFLNSPKNIFFCGIGGVSMNSLAHISKLRGHQVSGYDRTPSSLTKQLTDIGIPVFYESDAAHVADTDVLVYTVAIPGDLPEYKAALERGIPVISRADYLGYLMSGYTRRIGVSGVHGKSTTTSMLERIFRIAGCDPTVSCGAPMKDLDNRCDRIGGETYFIFEACEYMDSFLDFYPTDAVVLNIELDHLDYFSDLAQMKNSFARFMDKAGVGGTVYLNAGDENVLYAAKDYKGHTVTFGVDVPTADYNATNITYKDGMPTFTLAKKGVPVCEITLSVPGAHSVCDAIAAAAVALNCGLPSSRVQEALSGFSGAARRMDYKGKTPSGALVYDDYAHHPTEIATTLASAVAISKGRVFCVFQPHTYSRTKELFSDFASVLAHAGVQEVILADIYSARETDTLGVSSALLAEAVRKAGGNCTAILDPAAILSHLHGVLAEGDLLVVMGAGDIDRLCTPLLMQKV